MAVNIIPRATWGARNPKRPHHRIRVPTPKKYLHHSAGAEDAGNNNRWADDVAGIQRFHMDGRGWNDIAYNLLADRSGQLWEGRGVGVAGGHTAGQNTISQAICAIGDYQKNRPSDDLLEAVAQADAHAVLAGWWPAGRFLAHQEAPGAATSCCGRHLIAAIPAIEQRSAQLQGQVIEAAPLFDLAPWVAVGSHPTLDGYWAVNHAGHVHSFGAVPFWGSCGGFALNAPIVDIAVHPTGDGYWLVAADGGVFTFGHACQYLGSMGGQPLNRPVASIASTPTGDGYWLLGEDGGVFAGFGDAHFHGTPMAA